MYQLYYYPNNASLAPHFVLQHLGCDYQLLLVDRKQNAQRDPSYLKLNPAGRIPTLVFEKNQVLFEAAAICQFLAEQHPDAELMPIPGSPLRAPALQWLTYLTNTLQAELMVRYYPHRHTADQSDEAIASVIEAQDQRLNECFILLNEQLSHGPYLLGAQLTICDYYLLMLLEWSLKIKPSPLTYPHLKKFCQQMMTLSVVQAVCDKEQIDFSALC
ncbi:Glutathione S-transferase GST-6.0 [Vibrio stylophorae]|uniref:Glutathione S-transferase GST-6.0 n=1 Tax=Vibrio stylophorae TaxID=659351 RepID=A0ABM8ZV91_9VIBR|nr:glutathione S-transferase family protein [Vibrio stylophorae]CAH0534239.1 Glutathione S-transferase GST-6.0 [Vibrio stylophorae]